MTIQVWKQCIIEDIRHFLAPILKHSIEKSFIRAVIAVLKEVSSLCESAGIWWISQRYEIITLIRILGGFISATNSKIASNNNIRLHDTTAA